MLRLPTEDSSCIYVINLPYYWVLNKSALLELALHRPRHSTSFVRLEWRLLPSPLPGCPERDLMVVAAKLSPGPVRSGPEPDVRTGSL